MESVNRIALVLVIIGGLNWLLVGLFNFDVVAYLFAGQTTLISRIIYIIIGVAGVWTINLLVRPRITS